jgi:hypothetical protein
MSLGFPAHVGSEQSRVAHAPGPSLADVLWFFNSNLNLETTC